MNSKSNKCCGLCRHMSCLRDDSVRTEPNIMGGCLKDGHIVVTDDAACNEFKQWDETD